MTLTPYEQAIAYAVKITREKWYAFNRRGTYTGFEVRVHLTDLLELLHRRLKVPDPDHPEYSELAYKDAVVYAHELIKDCLGPYDDDVDYGGGDVLMRIGGLLADLRARAKAVADGVKDLERAFEHEDTRPS